MKVRVFARFVEGVGAKSNINLDILLQQGFQDHQINFSLHSSHTKIQLIVSIFKVSKVLP